MADESAAASSPSSRSVRVGVIGCGRMGCSIAAWLALKGCKVLMFDQSEFSRLRAIQSTKGQLADLVQEGLLTQSEAEDAGARVELKDSIEAAADSDFIVEAVPDDLELKRSLFRTLDAVAAPHCILTTNSINFLITDVAEENVKHACCGLRFLHPVYFIDKVEVSGGIKDVWGSLTESTQSRAPPIARLSSLLLSIGLDPFLYGGGERVRLSPLEVERINDRQRRKIDASSDMFNSSTLFHSDGGFRSSSSSTFSTNINSTNIGNTIEKGPLRSQTGECCICFESASLALVLPCGHAGYCIGCGKSLLHRPCFICRQTVEKVVPWTVM